MDIGEFLSNNESILLNKNVWSEVFDLLQEWMIFVELIYSEALD